MRIKNDPHRGIILLIASIFLGSIVGYINPTLLEYSVWTLYKTFVGAYGGYWIDRILFPDHRPVEVSENLVPWSWLRRGVIAISCMLLVHFGS